MAQVGIGTPGLTPIRHSRRRNFLPSIRMGFCSPWLVFEAPYFAYGYPFGSAPTIATSKGGTARSPHGGITLKDPRLARSAPEETASEASAAALPEVASAVVVVGLAAVADLLAVERSVEGASTPASLRSTPHS